MWCNNSNETSSAGLLHGTIQHLTNRILNFVYFLFVHCVKELIIIIIIIIDNNNSTNDNDNDNN